MFVRACAELAGLTRLAYAVFGPLLALQLHWETVTGVYPWADHMPPMALLVSAGGYWLATRAESLLRGQD